MPVPGLGTSPSPANYRGYLRLHEAVLSHRVFTVVYGRRDCYRCLFSFASEAS
jgi:hypothetical protein